METERLAVEKNKGVDDGSLAGIEATRKVMAGGRYFVLQLLSVRSRILPLVKGETLQAFALRCLRPLYGDDDVTDRLSAWCFIVDGCNFLVDDSITGTVDAQLEPVNGYAAKVVKCCHRY